MLHKKNGRVVGTKDLFVGGQCSALALLVSNQQARKSENCACQYVY